MLRRALLALPLLALPARAQQGPPVARPVVLAAGPLLRLGDLFENAGPLADRAVGAAPQPGRRMLLDAADLAAIARRHGLPWRPLSGDERSVVERPGRPVPRAEIETLLRDELSRQGADPEAEIELPAFAPPLVPLASAPEVALEAAHYDAATRRFAATLVVAAGDIPAQRLRLAGRALPTVPVAVAARRLAVGEIVGAGDIEERRMRAERVRPGTAQRAAEVLGRQMRRPIGAGLPFMLADLAAPAVVRRHQPVLMVLDAPGLSLTAQGRAMAAAALGEVVPVMNLLSRAVVEAEAIGPGRVRVLPGAVPVRAGRGG